MMMKAAAGVVDFDEALEMVLGHAAELAAPATERVALLDCGDRVLAEAVQRRPGSAAVRPVDAGWVCGAGGRVWRRRLLRVAGQVRAGEQWQGGALRARLRDRDYDGRSGAGGRGCGRDGGACGARRMARSGGWGSGRFAAERISFRVGAKRGVGEVVLPAGTVIDGGGDCAGCGLWALLRWRCFASREWRLWRRAMSWWRSRPRPEPQQIRNSNSYGLAALVAEAGGEAVRLPIARGPARGAGGDHSLRREAAS